MYKRRLCTD